MASVSTPSATHHWGMYGSAVLLTVAMKDAEPCSFSGLLAETLPLSRRSSMAANNSLQLHQCKALCHRPPHGLGNTIRAAAGRLSDNFQTGTY